jgi:hypothetical protein
LLCAKLTPPDLVETVREGFLVLASDLTTRFANRPFRDTFAVAPEGAIGRKLNRPARNGAQRAQSTD